MAKAKTIFACSECGGQTLKWQGQCPHCSAWNTLTETIAEKGVSSRYQPLVHASQLTRLTEVDAIEEPRLLTEVSELDRCSRWWSGTWCGCAHRWRPGNW